ncbi:MAG TPA: ATP-binding cassette domain-containing protein [Planctomycetaceae bacterium]|nr:ATP-binding cassette domain-containing protein [Planctomycetaceae bacterium]
MNDLLWQLEAVSLTGRRQLRLHDVSLEIRPGVTALLGWSGAGKTSLLNLLVGFERPDRGRVTQCFAPTQDRLPIFWSPHNGGLWPHCTVTEHLQAVAPQGARYDATQLLADFDLEHRANAYPETLSQGEQSRLAVARALASAAQVLVLDEPLVHVDPARAGRYGSALRQGLADVPTSLVLATHSPEIVLREAQRVACLHEGGLVWEGDVWDLYYEPPTAEAAAFLGPANCLTQDEARRWLGSGYARPCCLRPEQVQIGADPQGACHVKSTTFAGSIAETVLEIAHGEARTWLHRPAGDFLQPGERVSLRIASRQEPGADPETRPVAGTSRRAALGMLAALACGAFSGCFGSEEDPKLRVRNITSWSLSADGRRLPAPRSVTAGPDNSIYVLDNAGRVLVYDPDGKPLRDWRMPAWDVGKPEGICVFRDGRIGVADTHYHRVVFFDHDGQVVGMHGKLGKAPGDFIYPVCITQDADENYYIGEYGENDRVQKFSKTGKFLMECGHFGGDPGEFQRASGVVWIDGRLYVVDAFNNRVQVFSDDGKFLQILGGDQPHAALEYPYDISTDSAGNLFVVEYAGGRVSQFNLEGRLLGRFGSTGDKEDQFATPWGLTVDRERRVYVADTGNRRVVRLDL